MRTLTSTYRLQIHSGFTFHDAARVVPYIAGLGVSHVFLSPILQAAPGSTHGYDVVDHSVVSRDNGGEEGLRHLANVAHEHGVGIVVDAVPNHVSVPTPLWLNPALWDVLTHGSASAFASWFDVQWEEGGFLLPVLGDELEAVLSRGELTIDEVEVADASRARVLRYFDHVFPLAPGTGDLPVRDALAAQHYRLAFWRRGNAELNYRRFFDVTTLLGVRVEEPKVFRRTHEALLRLQSDGIIDGYRIDHPDGLADPRGYLRDLAEATGGVWTVVEKILEGEERLPADFEAAGTTGYDALWRVGGLFHDPRGAEGLQRVWAEFTGDARPLHEVAAESAALIVSSSLVSEVDRLVRLATRALGPGPAMDEERLREAIVGLLTHMDRYRAYIVPSEPAPASERAVLRAAADRAKAIARTELHDAIEAVLTLACGDGDGGAAREFVVRFAQTCGPVHAKSLEDTTFYRFNRFLAVNEVGSDPSHIGVTPDEFHAYAQRMLRERPLTMTTLSTHDTKRSEDVRARLAPLTELPQEWADAVSHLHEATRGARGERVDAGTEYFVWQTLAAAMDMRGSRAQGITRERLTGYLKKAMREAKVHTAWVDGDAEYEQQVLDFACAALENEDVARILKGWHRRVEWAEETAILGQKLVQLTMPGVPDVYQGNEVVDLSLVDPDNRRPVDYEYRRARAQGAGANASTALDARKFRLVRAALTTRRDMPEVFVGPSATYEPVASNSERVMAFARGTRDGGPRVISVVSRLLMSADSDPSWSDARVRVPAGRWRDLFGGLVFESDGERGIAVVDLLVNPVALLVREDS